MINQLNLHKVNHDDKDTSESVSVIPFLPVNSTWGKCAEEATSAEQMEGAMYKIYTIKINIVARGSCCVLLIRLSFLFFLDSI